MKDRNIKYAFCCMYNLYFCIPFALFHFVIIFRTGLANILHNTTTNNMYTTHVVYIF
jgi:hypothetical protein